jgi:hypothetical protein
MKDIDEYCIKHKKSIKDWGFLVCGIDKNRYQIKSLKNKRITSFQLVKSLVENNHVKPLTFDDYGIMKFDVHKYINEVEDFTFNPSSCCQVMSETDVIKSESINPNKVFYSQVLYKFNGNKPVITQIETISRTGSNVNTHVDAESFFDNIPNDSIIYLHNLSFEGRLLTPYVKIVDSIIRGTNIYKLNIEYKGKSITLKNSFL